MNILNNSSSNMSADTMCCRMCHSAGSDVQLNCGCILHAKCVPLCLLLSGVTQDGMLPLQPNSIVCPLCQSAPLVQMRLKALPMDDLDRAVYLRKQAIAKRSNKSKLDANPTNVKSLELEQVLEEAKAESSFLLLSHARSGQTTASDSSYLRTGRWTEEETAFCDFLLDCFDNGRLPMPQGLRLNDFLSELLLCKNSRLTKKMKNARLSVRSYEINVVGNLDVQMFTKLEEKFLQSVSSESTRLELRFNMARVWRSHLSNLSIQSGSTLVDVSEWMSCIEAMEQRASQADENIRKARRQRMGLALKTDVRAGQHGVFFSGMPVKREQTQALLPQPSAGASNSNAAGTETYQPSSVLSTQPIGLHSSVGNATSVTNSDEGSEADFISNMLDTDNTYHADQALQKRARTDSQDFNNLFDDFLEGTHSSNSSMSSNIRNNCGPFLEEIVSYMEMHDLPFEHVDVWVPSFAPADSGYENSLRLYHAGHASRSDLDAAMFSQMIEYGEYSTRFSFAPGVGLPGRVYADNSPSWERNLDDADPKIFERAGGARVYGVKTGFGLPIKTAIIGRIVIVMYSIVDLEVNHGIIKQCSYDFSKLCPEPKWKLVVEMGSGENLIDAPKVVPKTQEALLSVPSALTVEGTEPQLAHYHHGVAGTAASAAQLSIMTSEEEQQQIATLLGNHMPLGDISLNLDAQDEPNALLPYYMSLRLLLLRPDSRRSESENEAVDIVLRSYRGYAKSQQRSESDIALLLVKDWQYLKSTYDADQKAAAAALDNSNRNQSNASLVNISRSSHSGNIHEISNMYNTNNYTGSSSTNSSSPLSFLGTSHYSQSHIDDSPIPGKKRKISASEDCNTRHVAIVDDTN